MRRRVLPLSILCLLIMGLVAARGDAQVKATTVPISKEIIDLQLTVGQAAPARVFVLNGGMVRLALRNGPKWALVPVFSGGTTAKLIVMEILTDPSTGTESLRQVGSRALALGSNVQYEDAWLTLAVVLNEVRRPAPAPGTQAGEPCTSCCVTCDELTVCACYVEMECGKCCCPAGGCGCQIVGRSPAGTAASLPCAGCSTGVARPSGKK